ncbi:hypothetical protein SAMN03097699_0094 [Flavobacteriaceae bacterium MAR_2010_188]|nr:hypothetical protein SAMN03097699_0094 [Flavobacteriaceae bacterium MAR_2010_188]
MSLEKILSISGKPGLYKVIARTRTGVVAESLLDKKRMSVNVHSNISMLSEIAIYTLKEEVPLRDVFKKIKEKEDGGKTSIDHKEDKIKLEEYFFEVLPDYDEDRVYASDIKKVIQWYNLLHENDLLNDLDGEQKKSENEDQVEVKQEDKKKEVKEKSKAEGKKDVKKKEVKKKDTVAKKEATKKPAPKKEPSEDKA